MKDSDDDWTDEEVGWALDGIYSGIAFVVVCVMFAVVLFLK